MWRYAAARVTGTSHIKIGQPCQDRFVCAADAQGWLIAAVCDGAGSAGKSEVGAEAASVAAVQFIVRAIDETSVDAATVVRGAVATARDSVFEQARELGLPPRELACTLLLVAIGPSQGAAAQIGDGLITVKADADDWTWVFWPQHGEYVNVARFLTDEDALEAVEVTPLGPEIFECALMTDGLEPLALNYAARTAHTPFFEGMLAPLRTVTATGEAAELSSQLRDFLDSPRFKERADDDLTLVLACRTVPEDVTPTIS